MKELALTMFQDNISFLKSATRRFNEDIDGNRIFSCPQEKQEFDDLEKLSILDLWQKFYPNIPFDITSKLYLRDRGLLEEIGSERSGHDVYPVFGWKPINNIDWLSKHVPIKSRVVNENYYREGFSLNLSNFYSKKENDEDPSNT